ncbi:MULTISPECIES: TetR/AcrR family transcriptional regulator [Flavobacterium]|uniref:TetR/AcrR family transcriptional regulator n=2 Tax=Flavobacterium TaxID=237 RepID=A0AA94F1K0_9FLAO|nr:MULTISPECIES: TetR/AcrR family transcriptional regulator [Flavobacterium]OXA80255.1 TetR family transcriptional regulator [Flavobacterium columnare NBRC 100251 = ATCC 23463]AMA48275.1 TetR family transcriptional regulator [Flavobacterium covae]AND63561.1 TetR family transcriptional regulator [Flavobacterium covae]MCH4830194.1 TetR/AcrR family transcriptional regulator [Flavobacterium columnare]MCH4832424.1 TetR/AcrR family transcriptional regulator [Flavobacterium columnare]
MKHLLSNMKIAVNDKLYVKDPETSELGRKIIEHSIILIDEIGFELFTFKKLGERIQSNESSIYRYFENKHKLTLYLSSWYWAWMEYHIVFKTTNISDSIEKLEKTIKIVSQNIQDDASTSYINETILNRIIVSEFTKTFLTKEVDEENKEGYFVVYKRVVTRIVDIINEINPSYKYAKTLASTIVEGALHQQFIKQHFKTITDFNEKDDVSEFFIDLAKKTIL